MPAKAAQSNPAARLSGKVAVITGGSSGIGFAIAHALVAEGCSVVITGRNEEKLNAAAAKLSSAHSVQVVPHLCDVREQYSVEALFDMVQSRFGRLDILVNNAGISIDGGDFGNPKGFNTTSTISIDKLRQTFDTNFFAVVALTQTLLPLIKKSPAGRIVNLSSVLGSLTLNADPKSPIYNVKAFAYNASKTALNAFTVSLAAELRGTDIKVNSAHPGWVKTDMGGPSAPLELAEGGKTSVELATLPADGPSGGYFHLGQSLPW